MPNFDEISRILETIQTQGRGLSDWEKSFMSSCLVYFRKNRTLSDKQMAIVMRIYEEKTPTGSPFGDGFDSDSRREEEDEPDLLDQLPSTRRYQKRLREDR